MRARLAFATATGEFNGIVRTRLDGKATIEIIVPEKDLETFTGPTLPPEEHERERVIIVLVVRAHRARRKHGDTNDD